MQDLLELKFWFWHKFQVFAFALVSRSWLKEGSCGTSKKISFWCCNLDSARINPNLEHPSLPSCSLWFLIGLSSVVSMSDDSIWCDPISGSKVVRALFVKLPHWIPIACFDVSLTWIVPNMLDVNKIDTEQCNCSGLWPNSRSPVYFQFSHIFFHKLGTRSHILAYLFLQGCLECEISSYLHAPLQIFKGSKILWADF